MKLYLHHERDGGGQPPRCGRGLKHVTHKFLSTLMPRKIWCNRLRLNGVCTLAQRVVEEETYAGNRFFSFLWAIVAAAEENRKLNVSYFLGNVSYMYVTYLLFILCTYTKNKYTYTKNFWRKNRVENNPASFWFIKLLVSACMAWIRRTLSIRNMARDPKEQVWAKSAQ